MIRLADDKVAESQDIVKQASAFIDELAKKDSLVTGILVQVTFSNTEFGRYKDIGSGANYLALVGALECQKLELLREIERL